MSTGYWWNGHRYYETEREARTFSWLLDHSLVLSIRSTDRDPQLWRDYTWQLVAAVTVVPVATVPLLLAGGAIYAAAIGSALSPVLLVCSLGAAPFAWRIFSPVALRYLAPGPSATAESRIARLESIRADLTHTQAAELERIERSLHDGAQARIVALGMHLNAAEGLIDTDPVRAKAIIREARGSTVIALDQLRTLVRGINPPVLVERGLVDAVRALAIDAPLDVDVRSALAQRPEAADRGRPVLLHRGVAHQRRQALRRHARQSRALPRPRRTSRRDLRRRHGWCHRLRGLRARRHFTPTDGIRRSDRHR